MNFTHPRFISPAQKQAFIDKVNALAKDKGLSIHAASKLLGKNESTKYYAYKKALGGAVVKSVAAIHIHPTDVSPTAIERRTYKKATAVRRCVLVYGTLAELAQFAREVENAS